MERTLTCIVCPIGCTITAKAKDGDIVSISGNTCKRGEAYTRDEFFCPKRTVTTTVKCEDGGVVAVKTDTAIPKEKIFECMQLINSTVAKLPINIGDVIIENVFGSNVIATQNRR